MTRPRPPAVPSTYLSSTTQEQPLRKEQHLGTEEYLSALGRLSDKEYLSDSKEYLTRMGHCHAGSQEHSQRVQPPGREQNQLQEQICLSTQEQIYLSTQEQSVSFVSRPSPLLLLPDKVSCHILSSQPKTT